MRLWYLVFAVAAAMGLATGYGVQWIHALNLVTMTFAFIDATVEEYVKGR